MKKRFIDTQLWEAPWFRHLSSDSKLFWFFITARCDDAGFWEVDEELVKFYTGVTKSLEDIIEELEDRIIWKNSKKYLFIKKFIQFQYGSISLEAKPHQPAIRSLQKHNLLDQFIGNPKPLDSFKDKDKDENKDKKQEEDKICRSVMDLYHASLKELKPCRTLGAKRKRLILARYRANNDSLEAFKNIFTKVNKSPFLLGQVKEWSATLDWILKPDKWDAIMEDQYNNGDNGQKIATTSEDHQNGF